VIPEAPVPWVAIAIATACAVVVAFAVAMRPPSHSAGHSYFEYCTE
jgi:hypothetical protein